MNGTAPSSLPSAALARRLADLCGEERNVQADFLLHLDEYDRRRAYLEAGYGSLWAYCLEALHLRESAAGRRIAAMKVLRRFPALEAPLRDGRLSLSTVNLLGPILTGENLDELVARAAFKSNAETEKLVVATQPRVAPRDGVRRLPSHVELAAALPEVASSCVGLPGAADRVTAPEPASALLPSGGTVPAADAAARAPGRCAAAAAVPLALTAPKPPSAPRAELRPISADLYSLRVTIDGGCKEELELLASLLSHKTRGDLAAVLREAIRCGIATHGKRKGAVEPRRRRTPRAANEETKPAASPASDGGGTPSARASCSEVPSPRDAQAAGAENTAASIRPVPTSSSAPPALRVARSSIPMVVRREVWRRDGGRCAWIAPDGKRCGSTWKLEFDHIDPAALGGPATVANIRLACEPHNQLHAVHTFGREFMAPYLGGFTPAIGSHDP